jgi:hypothetical protein
VTGLGLRVRLEGARGADWLRRHLLQPAAPDLAVEIRPQAVGVVRLARDGNRVVVAAAASLELPPGCLKLSLTESNVQDADGLKKALQIVLERAGALRESRVALVLPDPVARLCLVPAAEVAARGGAEAEEFLRFRLRKAVPFEVRQAKLGLLRSRLPGADNVLVGAIFQPVLEGYEAALFGLGLHPGQVEIGALALLDRASQPRGPLDQLFVNWDEGYVTLVLTRAGWPVLIRTLTDVAATPHSVVREVGTTVVYYRDRLQGLGLGAAVVRSAALPPDEAVALLAEPLGVIPEVLDPWGPLRAEDRGPASQALAGAASCLARRAA